MKANASNPSVPHSHHVRLVTGGLAAVLALGLLATGCHRTRSEKATTGLNGVYQLVSIDGQTLPCTPPKHPGAPPVRSGTFVFKPDGTCSSRIVMSPPSGKEVVREVAATYECDGNALRMRWQGAGVTTGTMEGQTFTMQNEGIAFVYRR